MSDQNDARLVAVLEAKIDRLYERLGAANRAVYGASAKMQKDLDAANRKFEGLFAKGASDIQSRLSGVAGAVPGIDAVSGALGAMGTAGLVASTAVVALGAALVGAQAGIQFADELGDTANRLHVTTDALQEYRFAIRVAGGETKGADEALEAFSVNLGKAQQGLAKSQRGFLALGFTKDQIADFKTVDEALRAVSERIEGLGKTQQKDAIIQQLGLDGLKPLISEGVDEIDRLRRAAHEAGVVMDAALIERAGKMNDEVEALADVVNVQVKSAFVDLGPVLVGLLGLLARMTRIAGEVADAFRSIDKKREDSLRNLRARLTRDATIIGLNAGPAGQTRLKALNARITEIDAELAKRDAVADPAAPKPGADLLAPSKSSGVGKKGPTAEERRARGEQAVEAATQDELRARTALTENVEEIARLKLDELRSETDQKNARLRADVAAGKIDKAQAEVAVALNEKAAALREELIERQARDAGDAIYFERQRDIGADYDRIAQITASMSDTIVERLAIERRLLEIQRRRERAELELDLQKQVERGRISQGAADLRLEAFDARTAAELTNVTDTAVKNLKAGLLDAFEALRTGGPAGVMDYLATRFKAKLLDNLAEQLASIFLSAKIGGGGGGGGIGGILKLASKFIPGFANGTNSAPGGLAYVHKDELIDLPKGSRVIPSHALRAIGNMSVPRAGGTSVYQPISYDLRGAVVTEQLLEQMNQIAARHSLVAMQGGANLSQAAMARRGRRAL